MDMHRLSVAFRKFRSAIDELAPKPQGISEIVELDVLLDQAFYDEELSDELGKKIADLFELLLQTLSTLSEHLVAEMNTASKLMLASVFIKEGDRQYQRWSDRLVTIVQRMENLTKLLGVLREIKRQYTPSTN